MIHRMSYSLRIFILDRDDELHRIPVRRYMDQELDLPRFAGTTPRMVEVLVLIENRQVKRICRISTSHLKFDARGRLDRQYMRELNLSMLSEVSCDLGKLLETEESNVVDAQKVFLKRRNDHIYRWKLTPELEQRVRDLVFGRRPPGRSKK